MSKETPSKSTMKELPSSEKDLLAEVRSSGLLGNDPNLDKPRAKLISYIYDSYKIGRSFNHVSILVVGTTGVGKSSTIKSLRCLNELSLVTDEVYNQMSHLLSISNVFVSAIFRLITNCTREITPPESTNCTRNGTAE